MARILFETHLTEPLTMLMPAVGVILFTRIYPFLLWASRTFTFPLGAEFKETMRKWDKCIRWTFIPIAIYVFVATCSQYVTFQTYYRTGDYLTVEGYVEDFTTRYHEFMGEESFTVDGVPFRYTHGGDGLSCYYCYVQGTKKSVITGNGQYLKIGYVDMPERAPKDTRLIIYIEELPH